MDQIEKILCEITRLKRELDGYTATEALDYIESYINTLPEGHNEDLEEEISNYIKDNFFGSGSMGFLSNRTKGELDSIDVVNIARHFAEWQKQKSMQDFLEKACKWLSKQPMSRPIFWTIEDFKNYMQNESEK